MDLSLLFPLLILLLFIPIFLSGRRQRRQMAEMQKLQTSLSPGDEVMTTSGLRGTVVDTSDNDTIELEIAPDVTTTWLRAAIRERLNPADDVEDDVEDDFEDESVVHPAEADSAGREAPAEVKNDD